MNQIGLDPDFFLLYKNETLHNVINSYIIRTVQINNQGRAYDLNSIQRILPAQVSKQKLLKASKFINIDGTILAAPHNTQLEADFVALPKKLNFSKPVALYEETAYPQLQESDLIYRTLEWAQKLSKKISNLSPNK